MADYNYTGTGGLRIVGCASVRFTVNVLSEFVPGDLAYSLPKARKGCLERVVIKKYRIINNVSTGGANVILYVDTLNALWNAWELCDRTSALAAIAAYTAEHRNRVASGILAACQLRWPER